MTKENASVQLKSARSLLQEKERELREERALTDIQKQQLSM